MQRNMTDFEIVNSFLQSADKRKQIKVLAELNACSEKAIVDVLEQDGRVKKNMLHAWKISEGQKERFKKKQEERREQEKQMLLEAQHKKEMDACAAPPQKNDAVEKQYHALLDAYAGMWGMSRETVLRISNDIKVLQEMAYGANEHAQEK